MNTVSFKYKKHLGDFFRNTDVITIPNPQEDLEGFLVQFLKNYQSDARITYIDDLYKLLNDEFLIDEDKQEFINTNGNKTEKEIKIEIQMIENELQNEAYSNFYNLVITRQIEIFENGEK
jgi:hypothetical protein